MTMTNTTPRHPPEPRSLTDATLKQVSAAAGGARCIDVSIFGSMLVLATNAVKSGIRDPRCRAPSVLLTASPSLRKPGAATSLHHILAFEGESEITFGDLNFSEYEEWRNKTLGDATICPNRGAMKPPNANCRVLAVAWSEWSRTVIFWI